MNPISTQAEIDLRNVKLQQLLPDSKMMRASAGTVGAQIRLTGKGNTVAGMLATRRWRGQPGHGRWRTVRTLAGSHQP